MCHKISFKYLTISCTQNYRSVLNILRSVVHKIIDRLKYCTISCTQNYRSVVRTIIDHYRSVVRVIESVVNIIRSVVRTIVAQLCGLFDQLYAQLLISCVCHKISCKYYPISCTHNYRSVVNIL